jgi:hypothetical protein
MTTFGVLGGVGNECPVTTAGSGVAVVAATLGLRSGVLVGKIGRAVVGGDGEGRGVVGGAMAVTGVGGAVARVVVVGRGDVSGTLTVGITSVR